jgi:hypothetical protein
MKVVASVVTRRRLGAGPDRRAAPASTRGDFIGVDETAFPRDFAVFVRYHFDFLRKISAGLPIPPALTLEELDEFLGQTPGRYRVRWVD